MSLPTLQLGGQTLSPTEVLPLLKRYQLLSILEQELRLDQAIAHIPCTPEETAAARQRFFAAHQLPANTAEITLCDRYQMAPAELDQLATRRLRIEKFQTATWGTKVNSYFLQRKQQLDRVVYSMIYVESEDVACELYFRIADGEEAFADVARQYSLGAEAKAGGMVGPVALGSLAPTLAQLLAASQPGQLWFPQPFDQGWGIVRLESQVPAQLTAQVRQGLLDELLERWLQELD